MAIELFYWATPNGWKVSILLEELELAYNVIPVNIMQGDQFKPEFLKISPNNKIPAIIDPEGPDGKPISIFDSVIIMQYLAEKTDRFMPETDRDKWLMRQWLAFQMGHIGPMLGQAHHFRQYAPEKIDYAIKRYTDEAARLYGVLNKRLEQVEWISGSTLTIADFAVYPWIVPHERQGQDLADYPHLKRWYDELKARPAVRRGVDVMKQDQVDPKMDKEAWQRLFGNKPPN